MFRLSDLLKLAANFSCNWRSRCSSSLDFNWSLWNRKVSVCSLLSALCAPDKSRVAEEAWAIADHAFAADSPEIAAIVAIPEPGFLRAVATAQREPLSWTIVRALSRGFDLFWKQKKRKPSFWMDLNEWRFQAEAGKMPGYRSTSTQITPRSRANG
jgi:hypothetical protein